MASIDVTIRGAGAFGLSIAYEMARRGAHVQVIDPNGVAAGASGGLVGALAPHTPDQWNAKKQFQFESLIMAREFWPEVEACSGLPTGYARAGRVQGVMSDRALSLAQAREAGAQTHWNGLADWQVIEGHVIEGQPHDAWIPHSPTGKLIYDTLSAHIHPRKACHALARAIETLGGQIVTKGADQGAVIWATGWQGLLDLSRDMGKMIGSGVKGQAALLQHKTPENSPQIFWDGLHVIPHVDRTVAIGSTSERDFDTPDQTDAQLNEMIEKARAIIPALRDAPVLSRWAGVRPRATTRAPLLGRYPQRNGHYLANGGFKIGFGIVPMVARLMADLVLEGQDLIPPDFTLQV